MPQDLTFTFAELLKGFRTRSGWSQQHLADAVARSRGTISNWERGELLPEDRDVVLLVAEELHLSAVETDHLLIATSYASSSGSPPPLPLPPLLDAPPQPAPQLLPAGTITWLFTEVSDSARLWEQAPQAMRAALVRYRDVLTQVVGQQGGIVHAQAEAELSLVAFTRASDAVAAAAVLLQIMHVESWPTPEPLRLRTALHTGEAELGTGGYVGAAINHGVQLRAVVHGGQVLLSRVVQELVHAALPPGVELRDLGEHRLADLVRSEHLFQLVVPDVPADFPALDTLEAHHTNLPVQPTPLLGREQEVEELTRLLQSDEVRLLTLTGAGGIGKTRLGMQVAAGLVNSFPDGVFLVELAPIRSWRW